MEKFYGSYLSDLDKAINDLRKVQREKTKKGQSTFEINRLIEDLEIEYHNELDNELRINNDFNK